MKNLLLLIVLLFVGCTTLSIDNFNEAEYSLIPCKFEIPGDMDTATYTYCATLWTDDDMPIVFKSIKLDDLKRNVFLARVPSVGIDVTLEVRKKNSPYPTFISESVYVDLWAYDWGDGVEEHVNFLNDLEEWNSNNTYRYMSRGK